MGGCRAALWELLFWIRILKDEKSVWKCLEMLLGRLVPILPEHLLWRAFPTRRRVDGGWTSGAGLGFVWFYVMGATWARQ